MKTLGTFDTDWEQTTEKNAIQACVYHWRLANDNRNNMTYNGTEFSQLSAALGLFAPLLSSRDRVCILRNTICLLVARVWEETNKRPSEKNKNIMRARWAGEHQTNERASKWMPSIHIHNNIHMDSPRLIHSPGRMSCTHQSVWIMIMVALAFYWLFLWVFICFVLFCFGSIWFNMIFEIKIKSQLLLMGFEMILINATDTKTIETWLFRTATYNNFITHTYWRVCEKRERLARFAFRCYNSALMWSIINNIIEMIVIFSQCISSRYNVLPSEKATRTNQRVCF